MEWQSSEKSKESALGLFVLRKEIWKTRNDLQVAVKDVLMKVMSVYGEDEDFIEFLNELWIYKIYIKCERLFSK
jgi:hypothetical protein